MSKLTGQIDRTVLIRYKLGKSVLRAFNGIWRKTKSKSFVYGKFYSLYSIIAVLIV